jgi:hypothetical protein
MLSGKEATVKRLSRMRFFTRLCAAVVLLSGVACVIFPGPRQAGAISIADPKQNLTSSPWPMNGNGGAISRKSNPGEAADIRTRVEKFVHRKYNAVPYLKSKALGSEAVPILQAMLRDTSETANWATIIMALGFIGDSSSVGPFIDFLENRFDGDVNLNQFGALLTVLDALGFIANNGSVAALEYLSNACYVKTWMAKDLKWHFRHYSGESLDILLAKIGVNGLSYSGTDKAREILLSLEENPESAKSGVELKPNIEEGLERIDRIQKEGVTRVFRAQ